MGDREPGDRVDSLDSSKNEKSKENELKEEELRQISGGAIATCANCNQPINLCTCTNVGV